MPEKRDNDDEEAQRPFLDGSSEDVSLDKPSPLPLPSMTETTTKRRRWTGLLRVIVELAMAGAIVFLLLRGGGGVGSGVGGTGEKRSPVPNCMFYFSLSLSLFFTRALCTWLLGRIALTYDTETVPKKTVTFMPDHQYLNDGMFANESATLSTLHNWIPLSAGT